MIVVIEKNANGKIEFTQEELEELLEKARAEGVKEAQKTTYITAPSHPLPNAPNTPYWGDKFYYGTPQTISGGASSDMKLNGTPTSNEI